MITLEQLRSQYKPQILEIARKYGITDIRIYGSVARGEATENSDIDFLVRREKDSDAWGIGGFYYDVERLLGCKVDIATDGGISKYIRDIVINEAKPL